MIAIKKVKKFDHPGTLPYELVVYDPKTDQEIDVRSMDIHIREDEMLWADIEVSMEDIRLDGILLSEIKFFEKLTGKKFKLVEVTSKEEEDDGTNA